VLQEDEDMPTDGVGSPSDRSAPPASQDTERSRRTRRLAPEARNAGTRRPLAFVIKAAVENPRAAAFTFNAQKTMYDGKRIATGDTIFIVASESEGGPGLIARGLVASVRVISRTRGVARQTPRVSITVRRTALARRRLGRRELKVFSDWHDGRPETELNFKLYRQATNKIVGISDETAAFLQRFC
jgi:hypothetical protein